MCERSLRVCSSAEIAERGVQARAAIESILAAEHLTASKISDLKKHSMVSVTCHWSCWSCLCCRGFVLSVLVAFAVRGMSNAFENRCAQTQFPSLALIRGFTKMKHYISCATLNFSCTQLLFRVVQPCVIIGLLCRRVYLIRRSVWRMFPGRSVGVVYVCVVVVHTGASRLRRNDPNRELGQTGDARLFVRMQTMPLCGAHCVCRSWYVDPRIGPAARGDLAIATAT